MKKIVAAALLVSVAGVQAQDLKFGDLNYFLKQKQFNLTADANLANSKMTERPTGANKVKTQYEGYNFNTKLGYGFTDRLNAFFGLNYQYKFYGDDVTSAGGERYKEDGFQNPVLGLNYRLLNQSDRSVNLDFGAVLRLNVQDAKQGSATSLGASDGNAANGRSSLELNSKVGRKWNEANEWQLSGGLVYNKSGEYDVHAPAPTADLNVDQHSSVDFFLSAAYQYRPVNEFMVALSLTGTHLGQVDGEETETNTSMDIDNHTDYDFGFTAKYLICENFIAKFNYSQGLNPDFDKEVQDVNVEVKNRREKFLGLGVDFLF